MLLSILGPATVAFGSSTYSVLTCPSVQNSVEGDSSTYRELGKVEVAVPNVGAFGRPYDVVTVSLPSGVTFPNYSTYITQQLAGTKYYANRTSDDVYIITPQQNAAGNTNPFDTDSVFYKYSSPNSVEIYVYPDAFASPSAQSGIFTVVFNRVKVIGQSGDIVATFLAPDGSGFSSGTAVVGKVPGTGGTMAMAKSVKNLAKGGTGYIDSIIVAETVPGTITSGSYIEFKLPSGFKWVTTSAVAVGGWSRTGQTYTIQTIDDRTVRVLVTGVANPSTQAARIGLGQDRTGSGTTGLMQISVPDSASGEVTVDISGSGDISDATVVVAKVGDYGVTVSENEKKDVYAGRIDQKLGSFFIEESVAGSLVNGRTVKMTLPTGVKWTQAPTVEVVDGDGRLANVAIDSTDRKLVTATVVQSTNKATKFKIKDGKVEVSPAFSGPVKITLSGNAGVTGEVQVAEAKKLVEMSVSEVKNVVIGVQGQATGDILIKETKKDNIMKSPSDTFVVELDPGVTFSAKPTVTVTEGNLEIDSYKLQDNDTELAITIKSTSSQPSTIKISDVKITATRYVPEGAIKATLKAGVSGMDGKTALDETILFDPRESAGSVVLANCVTPAPADQGRNASFFIGSTVMTVNGSNIIMDAAPYIKNGRTYVPVRYLGDALGATTTWDAATQTVTVTKGDKSVVLVIGSKTAKVNGQDVAMDVAPEISNGRTMLPARYVAEGLGYQVGWNPALKQVVIQ